MCGVFPYHQAVLCNISWMSYNFTLIWYHILPGDDIRSHRVTNGSFPQDGPHFTYQSQVLDPQFTHNFCSMWVQIRASHDPYLGFDSSARAVHGIQGSTVFTSLKDAMGNTGGRPDGEAYREKPRRVLSTGASVSIDLEYPQGGYVCRTGRSLIPVLLGFLWRLPHVGVNSANSISSPFRFSREVVWGGGLKIPSF